jgi:hypothetical protein
MDGLGVSMMVSTYGQAIVLFGVCTQTVSQRFLDLFGRHKPKDNQNRCQRITTEYQLLSKK